MKTACPSCPDGNEWGINGPTGRACKTCGGKAYLLGVEEIEEDNDSPYCECQLEPVEEELAFGVCSACGKELL